jgi:WD40 repeat protein
VFDLITQRRIREINASFYVPDVAFNADGSRLAFIDTSLRIIRADTFAEAAAIPIASGSTGVVTWQPSAVPNTPNTGLAYSDGSSVRLYNTTTNTVQEFSLDEGVTAKALAFSPDGALLAALADDSGIERAPTVPMTLNLFDVQTGDLLLQMEVNDAWSMAFSADGTLLALGEANGVVIYGVE